MTFSRMAIVAVTALGFAGAAAMPTLANDFSPKNFPKNDAECSIVQSSEGAPKHRLGMYPTDDCQTIGTSSDTAAKFRAR